MRIYVLRVFDSQIREGAKSNNFSLSDIGNGEYVYSHFRVHKCIFFLQNQIVILQATFNYTNAGFESQSLVSSTCFFPV